MKINQAQAVTSISAIHALDFRRLAGMTATRNAPSGK
jgi:hypothetical protein